VVRGHQLVQQLQCFCAARCEYAHAGDMPPAAKAGHESTWTGSLPMTKRIE